MAKLFLVIFGPPGAGKGSISQRLEKQLGILHISTGQLLRSEIEKATFLGKKIKKIIGSGNLVDDAIMAEIIEKKLSGKDASNGFVLDGYPRNTAQAETLGNILKKHGKMLSRVVFVSVPKDVLVKRISGRRECSVCGRIYHIETLKPKFEGKCDNCNGLLVQRKDDSKEVVAKRFDEYEQKTKPLRDFYEKNNLLSIIDGVGNIDVVVERVKKAIK